MINSINFAKDARIIGEDVNRHYELVVQVLSFNQIDYLEIALQSVLNQFWTSEWMIVIHDDASSDGSQNLIEKFALKYSDRVIAVLQKENKFSKGHDISKSLQNLVSSDFISRLDADDYFLSTSKLRKQVNHLKNNPDVSIVYHDYYVLDEKQRQSFLVESLPSKRDSWIKLLMGNYIATSTATYRSENSKLLPFQLGGYAIQDWPLWVFLETQGKINHLDGLYSVYRIHERNSFAEKNNRVFEKDMIALHKLCAEIQTKFRKCLWILMLNLYSFACVLDRPTLGMSHKVLNFVRGKFTGARRTPITILPTRH